MFFCDTCAEKRNYPTSIQKSQGACELCLGVRDCNNIASKFLPLPPKPETIKLKDIGHMVYPGFIDPFACFAGELAQTLDSAVKFDDWLIVKCKGTDYTFRYRGATLVVLREGIEVDTANAGDTISFLPNNSVYVARP